VNISLLLAASGAALGVLIALALVLTRGHRAYANRVLALSVVISTTYLTSMFWRQSADLQYSLWLHLASLVGVLYGPALYLYVRAITDPGFRLHWRHLLHTLPYLVFLLLGSPLLREHFLYDHRVGFGVLFYLLLNAYLGYCAYLLYRHHGRIVESYASLEGISLRWLATLVTTILALSALGLLFALGRWATDAISYLIAFFAILRPMVFNPPAPQPAPGADPGNGPGQVARYETSSLTPAALESIWAALQACMQEQQPYLEPQLKIADLAELLELPPAHLSQTINQRGGCTFFTFINRYRVEYAQSLLRDSAPGQRTMLDVALSSGFNSESAFYKQFRALAGMTPRQYQAGPETA